MIKRTYPRMKRSFWNRCTTDDQLHAWVAFYTGLNVPRKAVCAGHHAPFDYLRNTYFEPAKDLVVWAPRGGGKTALGAVATLLDLVHKPGCGVRILGGSLDQSLRMWEQLMALIERSGPEIVRKRIGSRQLDLVNRSTAAVLTQSQRAVRGLRVQKLRCDEVEMFDPRVWDAAQLVTRTARKKTQIEMPGSPPAAIVRGSIEAISTWHQPSGLMRKIIDDAKARSVPLLHWCLIDVLERCPAERECSACPLWNDCRGVAKTQCDGFFSIDDAIVMKQRVSQEAWESEMLCRRPATQYSVFPSFEPAVHVTAELPGGGAPSELWLAMDFGFQNPFVCLWVHIDPTGRVHVIDEYVQPQRLLDEHIAHVKTRAHGSVQCVACDPAGAGRNAQTGMSDVNLLRREGLRVKYRASQIPEGLELIRAALRPAAGEVKLFVHPRCARLIRAMESYRYAPGGSELPVKDGEHDHPIDALRYFFVNWKRGESAVDGRRY